jgi:hypothetical protein
MNFPTHLTFLPPLLVASLVSAPVPAVPAERNVTMEALPPHLDFRVERRDANLRPQGLAVSEAVIARLKVWQAERFPITVCFFGGSPDLKVRIMNAALEWTRHEAKIPIDFGPNPQNPSQCGPLGAQVRIGFAYYGYWSLVGQDSDLANPNEQTMNFANWDANEAPEPEFTQTVLHEFGHALGLEHEHQNPKAHCEEEFDWPAIYSYLAGPPNYWTKSKVDHNMRRLTSEGLILTEFDPKSIMLYTFPRQFYKHDSSCYTPPNYFPSNADLAAIAERYPTDPAVARMVHDKAATEVAAALSSQTVKSDDRARAASELELLNAPSLTEAARRSSIERLQAPIPK